MPSLSARRAWIEIGGFKTAHKMGRDVALRKESVDRNFSEFRRKCCTGRVALRKESVDRNTTTTAKKAGEKLSLSARRAWIEIQNPARYPRGCFPSLSARRAWIEIYT